MTQQDFQARFDPGLVAVWNSRVSIPGDVWQTIVKNTKKDLSLLGTAMGGFTKSAEMLNLIRLKLAEGCQFRIVLQNPNCDAANIMAIQKKEPINDKIYASIERIRDFITTLENGVKNNFEVRFYSSWMGNSIFRGDDEIMVTNIMPWVIVDTSPTFYFKNVEGSIFQAYSDSFDGIWAHSERAL